MFLTGLCVEQTQPPVAVSILPESSLDAHPLPATQFRQLTVHGDAAACVLHIDHGRVKGIVGIVVSCGDITFNTVNLFRYAPADFFDRENLRLCLQKFQIQGGGIFPGLSVYITSDSGVEAHRSAFRLGIEEGEGQSFTRQHHIPIHGGIHQKIAALLLLIHFHTLQKVVHRFVVIQLQVDGDLHALHRVPGLGAKMGYAHVFIIVHPDRGRDGDGFPVPPDHQIIIGMAVRHPEFQIPLLLVEGMDAHRVIGFGENLHRDTAAVSGVLNPQLGPKLLRYPDGAAHRRIVEGVVKFQVRILRGIDPVFSDGIVEIGSCQSVGKHSRPGGAASLQVLPGLGRRRRGHMPALSQSHVIVFPGILSGAQFQQMHMLVMGGVILGKTVEISVFVAGMAEHADPLRGFLQSLQIVFQLLHAGLVPPLPAGGVQGDDVAKAEHLGRPRHFEAILRKKVIPADFRCRLLSCLPDRIDGPVQIDPAVFPVDHNIRGLCQHKIVHIFQPGSHGKGLLPGICRPVQHTLALDDAEAGRIGKFRQRGSRGFFRLRARSNAIHVEHAVQQNAGDIDPACQVRFSCKGKLRPFGGEKALFQPNSGEGNAVVFRGISQGGVQGGHGPHAKALKVLHRQSFRTAAYDLNVLSGSQGRIVIKGQPDTAGIVLQNCLPALGVDHHAPDGDAPGPRQFSEGLRYGQNLQFGKGLRGRSFFRGSFGRNCLLRAGFCGNRFF